MHQMPPPPLPVPPEPAPVNALDALGWTCKVLHAWCLPDDPDQLYIVRVVISGTESWGAVRKAPDIATAANPGKGTTLAVTLVPNDDAFLLKHARDWISETYPEAMDRFGH